MSFLALRSSISRLSAPFSSLRKCTRACSACDRALRSSISADGAASCSTRLPRLRCLGLQLLEPIGPGAQLHHTALALRGLLLLPVDVGLDAADLALKETEFPLRGLKLENHLHHRCGCVALLLHRGSNVPYALSVLVHCRRWPGQLLHQGRRVQRLGLQDGPSCGPALRLLQLPSGLLLPLLACRDLVLHALCVRLQASPTSARASWSFRSRSCSDSVRA